MRFSGPLPHTRPFSVRHNTRAAWLLILLVAGCASHDWVVLRAVPANQLATRLNLFSRRGPRPTERTLQVLRKYDLQENGRPKSDSVLGELQAILVREPSPEQLYSFAELAYLSARNHEMSGRRESEELYLASAAHAYLYLFDQRFRFERNSYDPEFRGACELYNASLESVLRAIRRQESLRPGSVCTITSAGQTLELTIVSHGSRFHAEDFDRIEFVSDYEVHGLANVYRTYGLGVPLIGVRKQRPADDPAARYYPLDFSFPVTAFLRFLPASDLDGTTVRRATLELYDPLEVSAVAVGDFVVPLETDISTPLAYFLNNPSLKELDMSTLGLLDPNSDLIKTRQGLYMLDRYQPGKIPVLMVHGLWSSPITWMEMFNDLRAAPEISSHYQFWFYLYPTGQPFLRSAAQLRAELSRLRATLDPSHADPALDQMILVGHSMGGLISWLQSVESGSRFWQLVSHRPLDEIDADQATKWVLASSFYFAPNTSVRRVVTSGTPFHGSRFSNRLTRWLANKFITLPDTILHVPQEMLDQDRADWLKPDLANLPTSIDSLSPSSPSLVVLRESPRAPWTTYHNIVGLNPGRPWWDRVEDDGDGVVSLHSGRIGGTASELVVNADHMNIHRHPRTILEVRRILLEQLSAHPDASASPIFLPPGQLSTDVSWNSAWWTPLPPVH
jgi:pimeloyl-ACP methyl ester carboxylesterase